MLYEYRNLHISHCWFLPKTYFGNYTLLGKTLSGKTDVISINSFSPFQNFTTFSTDSNVVHFNNASTEAFFHCTKKWSFPLRISTVNVTTSTVYSKYDQIRSFLRICSHLLKKSLIENFIFCVVPSKVRLVSNLENALHYFCCNSSFYFKVSSY